ncbi:MAG: hypothetical protein HS129_15100 [Leptospiraceae bacterium]|nr:hypothetical protein [Leptospiraceae bacterium]
MTVKFNRYGIREIRSLRIKKPKSEGYIEQPIGDLVSRSENPELNDDLQMIDRIRELQEAILRIQNYKNLEVEIEFPDE